MSCSRKIFLVFVCGILPVLLPGGAQAQQAGGTGFPDAPGKEVLMSRCFQCHNDAMWKDQRQDRKAWEAALYRMVGRGALWSDDEIKSMADYLAAVFGPQAKKPSVQSSQASP